MAMPSAQELFFQHRDLLRSWYRRVWEGELLSQKEDFARVKVLREYFELGASLNLTEREMVEYVLN